MLSSYHTAEQHAEDVTLSMTEAVIIAATIKAQDIIYSNWSLE